MTVTDALGMQAAASVDIEEKRIEGAMEIEYPKCYGDMGRIEVVVKHGKPPFRYRWSVNDIATPAIYAEPGNYSVLIVDSNFCSKTFEAVVTRPDPLMIDSAAEECNGVTDADFDFKVSGGTPPYKIYTRGKTVHVTDSHGCKGEFEYSRPKSLKVSTRVSHVTEGHWNDGFIIADVTDGNPPYSYQWGKKGSLHGDIKFEDWNNNTLVELSKGEEKEVGKRSGKKKFAKRSLLNLC